MTSLDLSHTVRLFTLLLLKEDDRHGYALMDAIERMTGERPSSSQIYPFLNKLAERGFVRKRTEGRKTVYALTDEGMKAVEDRIASFGEVIDALVEERSFECAHCGCTVYDGGVEESGEWFCCGACAASDE